MGGQTPDFFRARLDAMIDLRHPLAILSTRLPWKDIEAALAPSLTKAVREYNAGVEVIHRGRIKSMSQTRKKQLKRRQAIEPAIGHIKHDHRMIRCNLKGSMGDALHAISCAAGYNIRWLMRAIVRLGLKGLFARVFLAAAISTLQRSPFAWRWAIVKFTG
jgi:IS5 family transposase